MTADVAEERTGLWDTPATLYRAFDEEGRLLYVGISSNVRRRLQQHAIYSPWWRDHRRIETEEYETRRDASMAEERAIRSERPRWNKMHAFIDAGQEPVGLSEEELLTRLDELTIKIRRAEAAMDEGKEIIRSLLKDGESVRDLAAVGLYSAASIRKMRFEMKRRGEIK